MFAILDNGNIRSKLFVSFNYPVQYCWISNYLSSRLVELGVLPPQCTTCSCSFMSSAVQESSELTFFNWGRINFQLHCSFQERHLVKPPILFPNSSDTVICSYLIIEKCTELLLIVSHSDFASWISRILFIFSSERKSNPSLDFLHNKEYFSGAKLIS